VPSRRPPVLLSLLSLLSLVALVACGGGEKVEDPPERLPNAASYIPSAPLAQPTPTPTPGPQGDEAPYPATGGGGGASGDCGEPVPPPVSRINVKSLGRQGDRTQLDATPLVGPDAEYCRRIGYTDGRSYCPVRGEGHPERAACEAARVGRAADTGRPGPTWSANGQPCRGPAAGASCQNHPDNQFLALAWGEGRFRACAANGVCGEVSLP
jgi:hypothetical protein